MYADLNSWMNDRSPFEEYFWFSRIYLCFNNFKNMIVLKYQDSTGETYLVGGVGGKQLSKKIGDWWVHQICISCFLIDMKFKSNPVCCLVMENVSFFNPHLHKKCFWVIPNIFWKFKIIFQNKWWVHLSNNSKISKFSDT